MNPILASILESRKGHYVHSLEVSDIYELQCCIDILYDELIADYDINTFIDFITSMSLYCLDEDFEDEVYNFDIIDYINNL